MVRPEWEAKFRVFRRLSYYALNGNAFVCNLFWHFFVKPFLCFHISESVRISVVHTAVALISSKSGLGLGSPCRPPLSFFPPPFSFLSFPSASHGAQTIDPRTRNASVKQATLGPLPCPVEVALQNHAKCVLHRLCRRLSHANACACLGSENSASAFATARSAHLLHLPEEGHRINSD